MLLYCATCMHFCIRNIHQCLALTVFEHLKKNSLTTFFLRYHNYSKLNLTFQKYLRLQGKPQGIPFACLFFCLFVCLVGFFFIDIILVNQFITGSLIKMHLFHETGVFFITLIYNFLLENEPPPSTTYDNDKGK